VAVHARVTALSGSTDGVDVGIASFRDSVVPYAKNEAKGAILIVGMRASEERADALQADAAEQMGTSQPTVDRYQVAVFEV
jgi:hypothetical protein